ncbi:carboxymuconolactone decarboxylase family protein [Methylosinus sporium]|uniref:carboxymuconolactone decarboxylase family protein n=1 Tax=Methylosinus sporium TaxID=428 RepID=UPI00383AD2C6
MPRISTPAAIETAPAAARPLLETVKAKLGVVPNFYRLVANSPASLEGLIGLNGALAKGALDARTRERLAVAIAEFNGCGYCLSAHAYIGKAVVKLDDAEIGANRDGRSADPKAEAALRFALEVARKRGHVSDADLAAVRAAGFGEGEIIEIIFHVGLNTLTNYINEVADTLVDFPALETRRVA